MFSDLISNAEYVKALEYYGTFICNCLNVIFANVPVPLFTSTVHLSDVIVKYLLFKINNDDDRFFQDRYSFQVEKLYEKIISNQLVMEQLHEYTSSIFVHFKEIKLNHELSNEYRLVFILREIGKLAQFSDVVTSDDDNMPPSFIDERKTVLMEEIKSIEAIKFLLVKMNELDNDNPEKITQLMELDSQINNHLKNIEKNYDEMKSSMEESKAQLNECLDGSNLLRNSRTNYEREIRRLNDLILKINNDNVKLELSERKMKDRVEKLESDMEKARTKHELDLVKKENEMDKSLVLTRNVELEEFKEENKKLQLQLTHNGSLFVELNATNSALQNDKLRLEKDVRSLVDETKSNYKKVTQLKLENDNHIKNLNKVTDIYEKKLQELRSIVQIPMDYETTKVIKTYCLEAMKIFGFSSEMEFLKWTNGLHRLVIKFCDDTHNMSIVLMNMVLFILHYERLNVKNANETSSVYFEAKKQAALEWKEHEALVSKELPGIDVTNSLILEGCRFLHSLKLSTRLEIEGLKELINRLNLGVRPFQTLQNILEMLKYLFGEKESIMERLAKFLSTLKMSLNVDKEPFIDECEKKLNLCQRLLKYESDDSIERFVTDVKDKGITYLELISREEYNQQFRALLTRNRGPIIEVFEQFKKSFLSKTTIVYNNEPFFEYLLKVTKYLKTNHEIIILERLEIRNETDQQDFSEYLSHTKYTNYRSIIETRKIYMEIESHIDNYFIPDFASDTSLKNAVETLVELYLVFVDYDKHSNELEKLETKLANRPYDQLKLMINKLYLMNISKKIASPFVTNIQSMNLDEEEQKWVFDFCKKIITFILEDFYPIFKVKNMEKNDMYIFLRETLLFFLGLTKDLNLRDLHFESTTILEFIRDYTETLKKLSGNTINELNSALNVLLNVVKEKVLVENELEKILSKKITLEELPDLVINMRDGAIEQKYTNISNLESEYKDDFNNDSLYFSFKFTNNLKQLYNLKNNLIDEDISVLRRTIISENNHSLHEIGTEINNWNHDGCDKFLLTLLKNIWNMYENVVTGTPEIEFEMLIKHYVDSYCSIIISRIEALHLFQIQPITSNEMQSSMLRLNALVDCLINHIENPARAAYFSLYLRILEEYSLERVENMFDKTKDYDALLMSTIQKVCVRVPKSFKLQQMFWNTTLPLHLVYLVAQFEKHFDKITQQVMVSINNETVMIKINPSTLKDIRETLEILISFLTQNQLNSSKDAKELIVQGVKRKPPDDEEFVGSKIRHSSLSLSN